ncbi:hypothetical protein CASFOL_015465 [Castilleja foliolosa]|uniref:Exocyst subunit Exo70 family protein n=1 Tax=Castilleja foliolosa TaxID=1961234 RepID=A0ABD3DEN6_9LAMI
MAQTSDQEHHVMAAAYHLVKALESTKNLSNDTRKFLGDLDVHLSTMIIRLDEADSDNQTSKSRLFSAHKTITTIHSNHPSICDSGPLILSGYLQAVAELQSLIPTLHNDSELLDRAQSTLQMAMARLEDELMHTLVQNKLCFEPEYVSESPTYNGSSIVSYEDEYSVESASQRDRGSGSETDEYVMDFIHPDVIPQIKSIADTMFNSGYEPEFCWVFTAFWRDTLAEYMKALDVEQLGIEDVLGMDWKCLNSRIKKWRVAIKCIIRVYFVSAKRVFDQVFQEHGHIISLTCLFEASKAHLLCLLNFGLAVSIGPHKPESLFCLLNMYEDISALTPDVNALFPDEIGSTVRIEFLELSTRLGDSAKVVWDELGAHIASRSSSTPFVNGGIHPLTKYVMNYILLFTDYADTLDLLIQGQNGPNNVSTGLKSLMLTLEANLENKSNLYKDCSLKHIFMMNNIHYMVQKIGNSTIGPYFGDKWVRNHVGKFRQHAMSYERVTWNYILNLLREDGKTGRSALKAKCRAFVIAFEGVYKSQTRWCVPDLGLREDLRISASMKVIQAYRNFVEKINNNIGEKHIKYTEHELGTYILDLLEGSSKSLNRSQKR